MGKQKTKDHYCIKCNGKMVKANIDAFRRSLKCESCGRVIYKIGRSKYL